MPPVVCGILILRTVFGKDGESWLQSITPGWQYCNGYFGFHLHCALLLLTEVYALLVERKQQLQEINLVAHPCSLLRQVSVGL